MMNLFLYICSFFVVNVFAKELSDQQHFEKIIKEAIEKKQEIQNTGVAISVFTKDRILYSGGFGFRDQEKKLPMTDKTLIGIASTTKAFTALDLKLLENRNFLKITDKIQTHLPNFELSNEFITQEATIEDLLSHQVGLPRHDFLWYIPPFERRELLEKLKFLDFPENANENFRKKLEYSNLLYMVAGVIVEEKSGKSWESFTQENILNPLGMNETFFGPAQIGNREVATPYYKEQKLRLKNISNIGPAGSIYSNVKDMTKWIQSFMNNYWANQEDLLKPRIPLIEGPEGSMNYAYGLGWAMTSYPEQNLKWFFHDGNIDGFSTMVLFSDVLNIGVVVLINQHASPIADAVISEIILDRISLRDQNKSKKLNYPKIKMKPLQLKNENNLLLNKLNAEAKVIENKNQTKKFHHPAYGEIAYLKEKAEEYVRYYNVLWKLSDYNENGFNKIGENEEISGMRFLIKEESLEVPFQDRVPNIKFK